MRVTHVASSICLIVLPAVASAQGSPKIHELKASPATVHRGFFDASLKPVLTIDSGDIVRLETATGNPRWFPYERGRVTWIDVDRKIVQFAPGIEIPAKPFWGVIGVAPPSAMGRVGSGGTKSERLAF